MVYGCRRGQRSQSDFDEPERRETLDVEEMAAEISTSFEAPPANQDTEGSLNEEEEDKTRQARQTKTSLQQLDTVELCQGLIVARRVRTAKR